MLTKLGYHLKDNAASREKALKKAVKKYGPGKVVKKINYVRILSKSNKTKYNKYTRDMKFVQKMEKNKVMDDTFGVYCPDCNRNDWMGETDCYSCTNCGWCIDPNGNGSCGIGNASGPLFKDCRSWYYNGQCMWGPECDYVGPIYYDNDYWDTPWYSNWWYWGWGGPRRRYRRKHHRRRHPRGQLGLSPRRRGGRRRNMNRMALRRNMARSPTRRVGGGRAMGGRSAGGRAMGGRGGRGR